MKNLSQFKYAEQQFGVVVAEGHLHHILKAIRVMQCLCFKHWHVSILNCRENVQIVIQALNLVEQFSSKYLSNLPDWLF